MQTGIKDLAQMSVLHKLPRFAIKSAADMLTIALSVRILPQIQLFSRILIAKDVAP
jgi:hypothetical protein